MFAVQRLVSAVDRERAGLASEALVGLVDGDVDASLGEFLGRREAADTATDDDS